MRLLTVRHVTTYRYAEPVRFGEHRMMFRPAFHHFLQDSVSDVSARARYQNHDCSPQISFS